MRWSVVEACRRKERCRQRRRDERQNRKEAQKPGGSADKGTEGG